MTAPLVTDFMADTVFWVPMIIAGSVLLGSIIHQHLKDKRSNDE